LPNNASLVVAGDFDESKLQSELEALLAVVEARAAPAPARRCPGRTDRGWSSSIARPRPRASCAWSRRGSIASRPIDRGCRC
jgi:hypothetical protein